MSTAASLTHAYVLASAGSGKTWQLSSRYLQLIAAGAAPSSILASTFTRAAAGEIRDRILLRLAEAATDTGKLAELAGALKQPKLTRDQVLDLLLRLTGRLDQVQIRTLDSFFASIVSAFALELGLPHAARIVDEDEAARMRSDAIRATLETGGAGDMIELLRRLTQDAAGRAVTATIDETVHGLMPLYQEAPAEAWACVPEVRGRLDDEALAEAVRDVEDLGVPPSQKRLHGAWRKSLDQIRLGNWDGFLSTGLPGAIQHNNGEYYGKPLDAGLVAVYRPLVRHARAVLVRRARRQTLATRDLLQRFDRHLAAIKRTRRALTFDDLSVALQQDGLNGRLEEIRFRIDATLRHLLLDEFQDTSLPQWRALEPLAGEIVSNAPGNYSFFCVGDVKQSLYGWRDAAPEVLDELPKLLVGPDGEPALVPSTLARSWRSSPIVIDVINRVFEHLDGNPALEEVGAAQQLWSAGFVHHDTEKKKLPGYAQLRCVRRPGDGEDGPTARLQAAADLVRQLHGRNGALSIGVLTRTNKAVARLLFELGPTKRRVPAGGHGGGALTDAPAVNAVCDLLRLADHPGDTVAAFNVAGGPLGGVIGLSDHGAAAARRRTARRVRRQLADDGYADTIVRWAAHLMPSVDAREGRRLLELVELADRYEPRATLRPTDFVEFVEQTSLAVARAAPVEVMTIHKSKGLEFDVVVLPDLEWRFAKGGGSKVVYERDGETGPITRICRSMKASIQALVPDLAPLFEHEYQRAARASLCTLYVAMPRARQGLFMLIDPPRTNERTPPKTAAGLLRYALADASVEPDSVPYEHGKDDWIDAAAGAPAPTPEPPIEIRLKPSRRPPYGAAAGPSRLADAEDAGAPADRLGLTGAAARERGTAIHAMFELIEWLEDGPPDEPALVAAARRAAPRQDEAWAREQAATFGSMLAHEAVRRLLSRGERDAATLRVWREQPYARLVDGAVQQGVIDRIEAELGTDGSVRGAVVIDFKTDAIEATQEAADAAAEHYRPQLTAYRAAAARLLRLDPAAVRTVLLFVTAGLAVDG